jgi:hypothetical protein
MRHLWLAILEGLVEHRRALLTLLGVILGVVLAFQVAFFFISTYSPFCGSCHIMKPYVESRKHNPTHADVACVECHYEYRFLISKLYLKYALGIYTTQLRAEVPDSRCLSCHERQELDPSTPFLKNIKFSHRNHLGHMRRGKHLHCTSCHDAQHLMKAVSGKGGRQEYPGVDPATCYVCHFKGAEAGQAVTGCLVCHGPPKIIITHQGFQFNHGTYLKRGVRCDLCHSQVVRGDANVSPDRCSACHVQRLEGMADVEKLHQTHLGEHAIDCFRCHNVMTHGKVQMTAALQQNCTNCHRPTHTPEEQMYIGIGGREVPDTPDTMFLARVGCDSCHVEVKGGPVEKSKALRESCIHCHGAGYGRMVDDWVREIGNLTNLVDQNVRSAESRLSVASASLRQRLQPSVADARHNVDFVRRARGQHNVHYAVELLRAAETSAAETIRQTGGSAPAPPLVLASPAGYCRVCHSTSHLSPPVGFEGVDYPHLPHLEAGLVCSACHSLEAHGVTTVKREDCRSCHHGDTKKECKQCHSEQDQLYHGRVVDLGVSGEPDVMAKADAGCTDCHDLASKEPLVRVVRAACVNCHEKGYDDMLMEWIRDDEASVQALAVRLAQARAAGASGERARSVAEAERIYRFMLKAKGVHNTGLSGDIYQRAMKLLEWVPAKTAP